MFDVRIIDNTDDARDEYGHWWGSDTFILSEEMIEALKNGKCVAGNDGEYATFIIME